MGAYIRGLPLSTYATRGGGGGSSLLYISIAYYMQKGGGWVQIACKIAYVLNGRPLRTLFYVRNIYAIMICTDRKQCLQGF